jgi:hypothetical protein
VVSSPLPTNLTANASETRVVEGGAVPVAEYAGLTPQTASTENYTQPAAETQVSPAVTSTPSVPSPSPEEEVQAVVAAAVGTKAPIPAPAPEPERSMVLPVVATSTPPVPSPSPEAEVQAVVAGTFNTNTQHTAPAPEPERSMVLPVVATSTPSSELLSFPISITSNIASPTGDVGKLPNSSDLAQTGSAYPAYYNPFPQDSFSSLACGFGRVSSYFQDHFAGISQLSWQQSTPACGSCIAVKCSNGTQCPNGKQVTVQITDSCGSCSNGDVNLSPSAFREVVGEAQQVVPVTWSVVPCKNYTVGTIYLWVGPGDTVYWRQVTFSNAAQPVIAASINGDRLQRGSDDRWVWQNNGHPLNQSIPMVVEIMGADGKKVSALLSSFNSQSLTIQL